MSTQVQVWALRVAALVVLLGGLVAIGVGVVWVTATSGEPGETYNVGSGVEASIEEIADSVLELTGKPDSLKTIVPDRPGHDRRYLLDSSKLRRELGWEPEIDFESGLRETVEWYASNRAWWEPLRERLVVEETAWT